MKIVLQNKVNGHFWKEDGTWTSDLNKAHDFETTNEAQKVGRECQLDVQVIIKFKQQPDLVFHVTRRPR